MVKESARNAGDLGSIAGWGRLPGGGDGNPFQYSCLENPYRQRSLAGCSPWGRKDPLEAGTVTHSSILAWRIPIDRGAWQGTVHRVAELDMTEATEHE